MNKTLKLERVPSELKYILTLLAEPEIDGYTFESLDWKAFLKQVKHHRIFPLLYPKIKNIDYVPNYVKHSMKRLYEKNTFQMLSMCADIEQINRIFTGHHIRVLFMKGPVLAQQLYGEISNRTSSDIDVLIPIDKLAIAEKALVENGYEKHDYIETVLGDWKWRHHHVTYFHAEENKKVEVHWRLNPGPSKEPSFTELWENRCNINMFGSSVYTLNEEYLFLFLIMHGARHGWSRLRWLYDIGQLVERKPDWQTISKLLKKYDAIKIGGQALYLMNVLFSTSEQSMKLHPRSHQLAQSTVFYLESMINLHHYPIPEKVSDYHASYLFSNMSFKQKVLFLLSFLYPYPEDKETLPLPNGFHFLYFGLRPFLALGRKLKKNAVTQGADSV
ncbi:nucleotidyltransferase domain-containing protein [Virgibacillus sp. W0181]|uniref:nucleotidyltransferase domain-containing protein n=1 Tax=Virgibacillus sp. W0181 TaxID=3391581 RepID=UPI003F4660CC